MTNASDFSVHLPVTIELSEREPGDERSYESKTLVEWTGETEIRIGFTDDENDRDNLGFYLAFSQHHMIDEDTNRAFHVGVDFVLTTYHIKLLRRFLHYLVKQHKDDARA